MSKFTVTLTADEIKILRGSFQTLSLDLYGVGKLFYDTQFQDDPATKERDFKGVDIDKQSLRLMLFVEDCIDALEKPDELEDLLVSCGERHGGYGTQVGYYPINGDNLYKILRIWLKDEYTPEVDGVWHKFYDLMADTMIRGQLDPEGVSRRTKWDAARRNEKVIALLSKAVVAAAAVAIGVQIYRRTVN